MSDAGDTTGLATPPDPATDRTARPVPERIAEVHAILRILCSYGSHLSDTLQSRSLIRGFATIAQFFGTATVATILPQLYRGLMRCHALDRLLRARAARGFDLTQIAPRAPARRAAAAPPASAAAAAPPAPLTAEAEATALAARRAEARLTRRLAAIMPLTFDTLPGMDQIEAEVRRAPIGRTIVLICRDLGISATLCHAPFWTRVFDTIRWYGGSLGQAALEMKRRERHFEKRELDRNPHLEWPEQTREGVRRVLGCFIGEPPAAPPPAAPSARSRIAMAAACIAGGAPLAVAATGPPQASRACI